MNEEEMDKRITEIIKETIKQIPHSSCTQIEPNCYKDRPEYEPRHIHCGTDRCKGLHLND